MIGCDFCPEWFHPDCLLLSEEEVNRLMETKEWKCPVCEGQVKIDYEEEQKRFADQPASKLPTEPREDPSNLSIQPPKRTKVNVGPGQWLWLIGDELIEPTPDEVIFDRYCSRLYIGCN